MERWNGRSVKVMPKNVFAELSNSYNISPEQFKFYHENGYLVIPELIDFASLYSYKQRFVQIAKGLVDKGNITVVKEPALVGKGLKGEDLINKLQDILYDDVFAQYMENPRLLHAVSQVIGPDTACNVPPGVSADQKYGDNITAMHSMFINKPPGTGRHPPHQDMYYFPFRPAHKIVAAWTAVDHVTVDNGSLYVVPGSHRAGTIHAHGNLEDSNKLYHGIVQEQAVAPAGRRVPLEMSPGDTVLFHPLLVHGSHPNGTENYRKSISCHYANSACEYVSVAGTVQEGVAREIEGEARRRGFRLTFQVSTCRGGAVQEGVAREIEGEARRRGFRLTFQVSTCQGGAVKEGVAREIEGEARRRGFRLTFQVSTCQGGAVQEGVAREIEGEARRRGFRLTFQVSTCQGGAVQEGVAREIEGEARRRGFRLTFQVSTCRGGTVQEGVAREIEGEARRRGFRLTFQVSTCRGGAVQEGVAREIEGEARRRGFRLTFQVSTCQGGAVQEGVAREIEGEARRRGFRLTFQVSTCQGGAVQEGVAREIEGKARRRGFRLTFQVRT